LKLFKIKRLYHSSKEGEKLTLTTGDAKLSILVHQLMNQTNKTN